MRKTDLAYMAGIVDGEGYICLARRNNGCSRSSTYIDEKITEGGQEQ